MIPNASPTASAASPAATHIPAHQQADLGALQQQPGAVGTAWQHAAHSAAPQAAYGYGAQTPTRLAPAPPLTGAYQSSGDAAIDRMIALEAACKRFGSAY